MTTRRAIAERIDVSRIADGRDPTTFVLDAEAYRAWETLSRRAPRFLPGVRVLVDRPSPFAE